MVEQRIVLLGSTRLFLADELMFIFGEPLNITDELFYTHDEMLISEKMMSYWGNFAKYR